MKTVCALLVLCLGRWDPPRLVAQQPGDSVRVQGVQGPEVGRLLAIDAQAVTFRSGTTIRTMPHVMGIEVWRPRNHAVDIAVSAVLFGLLASQMREDPLLGAGVGAAGGVVQALLWPGRWHRVMPR